MAFYIDDQAASVGGSNLGQRLDAVQQQLSKTGRVVVEVQVDGQTLLGEQIHDRAGETVDDSVVRIYSADPSDLALDVLDQIRARLDEARTLQTEAADLLQADQKYEALQKVSQAIDPWLQTQEAVLNATGLLEIDVESFIVENEPMSGYTQELLSKLEALKQLVIDDETVGLADALAYEWPPLTDRWENLVSALIEHIEANASNQ